MRYLTGMLPLRYQGITYTVRTKKVLADANYKDRQTLEFNIKLPVNHYMNQISIHICFLITIKKSKNDAKNLTANITTANNFCTLDERNQY